MNRNTTSSFVLAIAAGILSGGGFLAGQENSGRVSAPVVPPPSSAPGAETSGAETPAVGDAEFARQNPTANIPRAVPAAARPTVPARTAVPVQPSDPKKPAGATVSAMQSRSRLIEDVRPERVQVYPDDPESAWWEINPHYAFDRAQREQKPLLLLFTGMWNTQAMALSEEVFSTKSFNEYVKENLVICYLNYPRNFSDAPDPLRRIKEKFKVKGYPNVLFFNPNGEVERGIRGYRSGRPVDYFHKLKATCHPVLESIKTQKANLLRYGYRDWSNFRGKIIFAKFVDRDASRVRLQDVSGQKWIIKKNDLAPLLHLASVVALLGGSAFTYLFLIDEDERYDIFDLAKGRPVTAAIGAGNPVVAQAKAQAQSKSRDGKPLLRAVPLDLNDTGVLEEVNRALSDLTDAVVPSVVSIDTTTNVDVTRVVPADPFGFFGYRQSQRYKAPGLGSGVIVTDEGHIVTNHHVVAGVDEIRVTAHDGSVYTAEWVGSDPNVDVAVLRLKASDGADLPEFRPLGFGDSDNVRVGETVLAVGNPFGLNETVTRGIISAKQRELSDGSNEYFQVDAVINPGNSGGPLVNVRGEIVGINVAIFTGQEDVRVWQGIGLAIPANEVKEVFEAIVLGRPLIRGYIGLELENISRNYAIALGLKSLKGALITDVVKGSPAREAGLNPGDVILKFDGKEIATAEEALSRIRSKKAGESTRLTIVRKGEVQETEVGVISKSDTNTLRLRSDIAANGQSIAEALGIKVSNLSPRQRSAIGLNETTAAIAITEVKPGSQAEQRFQPGDLIHRINQDPVTDTVTFYDLLGSLPQDKVTVMVVSREGRLIRAFLNP
jgi:serine protease Do